MPHDADSCGVLVGSFHELLWAEIRGADVFDCDFSTSTDVDRVVGRIVLLDAYSPYFALWLACICGIPKITLTGTVEDWQKIRARVDTLAQFGLDAWRESLAAIVDQFVRAAAGDVDTAFWRRIYNPVDAYGGEVITGWAARFYPYLRGEGVAHRPNPLLELPIDEPRDVPAGRMGYSGPGSRSDSVPATLSKVNVHVNDQVEGDNRVVALHAGLVGIVQDRPPRPRTRSASPGRCATPGPLSAGLAAMPGRAGFPGRQQQRPALPRHRQRHRRTGRPGSGAGLAPT